jgi:cell division FtsZ-interacting protein ZapD
MDNDNERLNKHHLRHYYRKIIRLIGDPRIISIFGPGEARTELEKEIKRSKRLASKIISIEPADKMTQRQIAANIRRFFALGLNLG